jgi:hypothetical protein
MGITVILPTRGRPDQAREAVESVLSTRRLPDTFVSVVLDIGDPTRHRYHDVMLHVAGFHDGGHRLRECSGNMIERTNLEAMEAIEKSSIIGWMADDNRMRTPGWDERVTEALEAHLFANLNDLFWSEKVPDDKPVNTYIRSCVVRALGWFANPSQAHHYMDDTWRLLGYSTDSMVYLRDVVCEHMHPVLGKSKWDDGYKYTESPDHLLRDQQTFQRWVWDRWRDDREKVKLCL